MSKRRHMKRQVFDDRGALPLIKVWNPKQKANGTQGKIPWFHLLLKMILSIDKTSNKFDCIINGNRRNGSFFWLKKNPFSEPTVNTDTQQFYYIKTNLLHRNWCYTNDDGDGESKERTTIWYL